MINLIAHLNDAAFQSLLISSIETFPSGDIGGKAANGKACADKPNKNKQKHEGESFGLLFGQRIMKREDLIFNVTLAVPMQTASRTKETVRFSERRFSRIREVTESFPYLEFLGTFHSHPCRKEDYDARSISEFSDIDESSAIALAAEYGDEILEVILGLTVLDRHSKRPALMNGETIQSYCGRFKYSLSAYCTYGLPDDEDEDDDDEDDDTPDAGLEPLDRLICPLAAHGGEIYARTAIEG